MKMGQSSILDVSQEPGQWVVWTGVVLMGTGLAFVFYLVHTRVWVVPVQDPKTGGVKLWIGGSANRNRESFEARFNDLVAAIEGELRSMTDSSRRNQLAVGR
jgi:cytochrome c biogenesis protein